ncbi:haloacid dehalogenase [Mucilaginibacter sp. PAMC 26640]|nr:haloacid dehalogenase [Mucilaginibacter sp. PAMC 26640]
MRYHTFVTDYDGTIAENERVSIATIEALSRLKATGRKLILVTGRELDQLQYVFPEFGIFDMIVAENGALIYSPASKKTALLGNRPPEAFIRLLQDKNIPLSVGQVIVATWEPHQEVVLEAIRNFGLEYQLIFNKGAIMILPPGINKATGLHAALIELNLSEHNTVAVGDAENDNALLEAAECAVAVNNALPLLKENADWVTNNSRGAGVVELVEELLADDLLSLDPKLARHFLPLGKKSDGTAYAISPYGKNILLAGTSGCGKTTFTAAFVEQLILKQYQFCLIDPEGDYQDLPGALTIGDGSQPPLTDHVIKVLSQTSENAIVCFLAIPLGERPAHFKRLLTELVQLRESTGHPHFIIIDEAHHLLPKEDREIVSALPEKVTNIMAITTKPELLSNAFLQRINLVIAMGDCPEQTMESFSELTSAAIQISDNLIHQRNGALVWQKEQKLSFPITGNIPAKFLMRHKRKYASGDMYANSFFFTGPNHKLNLKANNLMVFIQMATGVDDDTWLYHLHRHDYSNWFRNSIKDPQLSDHSKLIENAGNDPGSSRRHIFKLIMNTYTSPA